jgi:hypothetical protein
METTCFTIDKRSYTLRLAKTFSSKNHPRILGFILKETLETGYYCSFCLSQNRKATDVLTMENMSTETAISLSGDDKKDSTSGERDTIIPNLTHLLNCENFPFAPG